MNSKEEGDNSIQQEIILEEMLEAKEELASLISQNSSSSENLEAMFAKGDNACDAKTIEESIFAQELEENSLENLLKSIEFATSSEEISAITQKYDNLIQIWHEKASKFRSQKHVQEYLSIQAAIKMLHSTDMKLPGMQIVEIINNHRPQIKDSIEIKQKVEIKQNLEKFEIKQTNKNSDVILSHQIKKSIENISKINDVQMINKKQPVIDTQIINNAKYDTISQIKSTKNSGADESFKSQLKREYRFVNDLQPTQKKDDSQFKGGNWYKNEQSIVSRPQIKEVIAKKEMQSDSIVPKQGPVLIKEGVRANMAKPHKHEHEHGPNCSCCGRGAKATEIGRSQHMVRAN